MFLVLERRGGGGGGGLAFMGVTSGFAGAGESVSRRRLCCRDSLEEGGPFSVRDLPCLCRGRTGLLF